MPQTYTDKVIGLLVRAPREIAAAIANELIMERGAELRDFMDKALASGRDIDEIVLLKVEVVSAS